MCVYVYTHTSTYLRRPIDDPARGVGVEEGDGRTQHCVYHLIMEVLRGSDHSVIGHHGPRNGEDGHDAHCGCVCVCVCVYFVDVWVSLLNERQE